MVGEERKKEDGARTRCLLGELQYYHKETYTEEEWRGKEGQRRSKRVSLKSAGDGLSKKNGGTCKQSEPYAGSRSGGKMEVSEGE